MSILQYKKNIYSQNGEDGIIEYIFKTLGVQKGTFIEFGAWDGKFLSNSYNLLEKYQWDGIYIEGDAKKAADLKRNFHSRPGIDCVHAMVGFSDHDNLDTLIEAHSQKRAFDFISIDVDGYDYFIFEKIQKYLPKVICIEVNAGHDPNYPHIISENVAANNIGQSIRVISEAAEKKGYFPLCYTGNLFLIKNEYKDLFAEHIKSYTDIYVDFLTHLEKPGVDHLFRTFVKRRIYNGHEFNNPILTAFCNNS